MSDTTGTQVAVPRRAPLRAGATALGIVPQTIEDVWKIAKYVVMGKMAPDGLMKGRDPDEQASAVSTIILSGLELGLSPMVALRSFGMINGKPGLYGDGLINVCRRHSTAEYVKLGFVPGYIVKTRHIIPDDLKSPTEEYRIEDTFADNAIGWCEAKRSDTGEVAREEFSVGDAKRAGLWQTEALVRRRVWEDNKQVWKDGQPNDATWFRYPKRMLQWRAAGYCLRNLFADVLGGVPTMDELQEVFGEEEMRDVTPAAQITRSGPPPVPDEPEPLDVTKFVQNVIDMVAACVTEEQLINQWEIHKIDALLADHTEALDEVYDARNARLAVFAGDADGTEEQQSDAPADDGQADIFPGDKP